MVFDKLIIVQQVVDLFIVFVWVIYCLIEFGEFVGCKVGNKYRMIEVVCIVYLKILCDFVIVNVGEYKGEVLC